MSLSLQTITINIQDRTVKLLVPDAAVVKERYKKGEMDMPYWSQVWPAARALGDFIVRYPAILKNKKVLELAAGLGLPSLLAAQDASSVISSDYRKEAVEIITQAALLNNITNLQVQVLDWQCLPDDLATDVLLLSDINYDPASFAILQQVINRFLAAGTHILLSTPQRLMAKDFIAPFLPFCQQREEMAVSHKNEWVNITVLSLCKEVFAG